MLFFKSNPHFHRKFNRLVSHSLCSLGQPRFALGQPLALLAWLGGVFFGTTNQTNVLPYETFAHHTTIADSQPPKIKIISHSTSPNHSKNMWTKIQTCQAIVNTKLETPIHKKSSPAEELFIKKQPNFYFSKNFITNWDIICYKGCAVFYSTKIQI